jgi:acyl carrier protein
MDSYSQVLVRHLIGSRLQIDDEESIADTRRLDDLGLDVLELVFVAVQIEELAGASSPFPVGYLAEAETVGDMVAIVEAWLDRDTALWSVVGTGEDEELRSATS